ncbi:MAG TPA: glycosyltransferase family 4 protein [Thermoanaerobaculia bacterium]|nr:glycosyltransferase family 4 protein [Thermoanaerobaculia bacterium]
MPSDVPRRFLFVSSNLTWGGSEHLWSGTAIALAEQGHHVTAFKLLRGTGEPAMRALRERGGRVVEVARMPLVPRRAFSALVLYAAPLARLVQTLRLRATAARTRPDLVLLSVGTNVDGIALAAVLRRLRLPYAIVAHKAAEQRWPSDADRPAMRDAYTTAVAAYFVSEHNLRLTEEQLGVTLENAAIVRNPFGVPYAPRTDWPSGEPLRLACVARLLPPEKGQDLLLRVLARERWRSRALSVTFFGNGPHRDALNAMASRLALTSVTFAGHVDDVAAIWRDHHALVLPSRCEGLPIVLVEAMLSGRVPIVTNAGGNAEVVEDGVTGFVAAAPSEDALDEAMERAWQRRDEWRAIGARAAESIRTFVPPDPLRVFAAELDALAAMTRVAPRAAVVGLSPS